MKGKKFLVSTVAMSLALAIALGGAFVHSTVKSNAGHLEIESDTSTVNILQDVQNSPEYVKAEQLFAERNSAFSKGEYDRCNEIDEEINKLGYRDATEEELDQLYSNDVDETIEDDGTTGCQMYSKRDKNTKVSVKTYKHKVDNKTYTIKQYVNRPKNSNSKLRKFYAQVHENKKAVASGSLACLSATASTVASAVNSKVGNVISAYDIIKSTIKGASKKTQVKNVKVNYSIDIAETITHLDLQIKSKGKTYYIPGATYNFIDYTVNASMQGDIKVKNGYAYSNIKNKKISESVRSVDHGNMSMAVHGGLYGEEHVNTVIRRVDIKGLKGKKLFTYWTVCGSEVAGRGDYDQVYNYGNANIGNNKDKLQSR